MSFCKLINGSRAKVSGKIILSRLGSFKGFDVYTTTNPSDKFNFTLLFNEGDGFSETEKNYIKQAAGYWAEVLKDTQMPALEWSHKVLTYRNGLVDFPIPNFSTTGMVLILDKYNDPNSYAIAYASQQVLRTAPGEFYDEFTFIGNYVTNAAHLNDLLVPTNCEVEPKYYWTALHEIGHLLGIALYNWQVNTDQKNITSPLRRSFYVAASPVDKFPTNDLFYTTLTGDGSRTNVSYYAGTPPNRYLPLAGGYYAYNEMYSPPQSMSYAVSAYNEIYSSAIGINLTAIPLENILGPGSFGTHWHEGGDSSTDIRTYWGTPVFGMVNEVMSPLIEMTNTPCPVSKVTLGGLADLGWTVDYSKAHTFDPFTYMLSGDYVNFKIRVTSYEKWSVYDPNSFIFFYGFKPGYDYTFVNYTTALLTILQGDHLTPVPVTQDGNNYTFEVSQTYGNSLTLKLDFGQGLIREVTLLT